MADTTDNTAKEGAIMATKIVKTVTRTSDFSEAPLTESDPRVKLTFVIDGATRRAELDLTTEEAEELRAFLKPWFDAVKAPEASGDDSASKGEDYSAAVRRWARQVAEASGGTYVITLKEGQVNLTAPAAAGRVSAQWKEAYDLIHTPTPELKDETDAQPVATEETEPVKAGKGK
jgi:hypothetical protein